jgi:hypothetical protein
MSDDKTERSLGRIEGALEGVTGELRNIREFLTRHEHEDRVQFTEIRDDISKINKRVFLGSGAVATLISMVGIWLKGH